MLGSRRKHVVTWNQIEQLSGDKHRVLARSRRVDMTQSPDAANLLFAWEHEEKERFFSGTAANN
jgi:hypothetical protein